VTCCGSVTVTNNSCSVVVQLTSTNVVNIITEGPVGPTGPTGPTGAGVPVGGTTGQILAKNSNTNYDTLWVTSATPVTSVGATAPITSSGGTTPTISTSMSTSRLLGRTTAGTGVAEQISIGAGLSLSSGTLSNSAITVPGGSNTAVQFNDSSSFGGVSDLTYNKTTTILTNKGDLVLDDSSSFTTKLVPATPTVNRTVIVPDATGLMALVPGAPSQVIYNNTGQLGASSSWTFSSVTGWRSTNQFGYGTGAGSTATQSPNKTTSVTLNKPCGQITCSNAALAADTTVSFTLTNNTIEAGDVLVLNHVSGGTVGSYLLNAQSAAGSATINIRNISTGPLSEAIVIAYAIIKAVTS
jgi:hypothetical protein